MPWKIENIFIIINKHSQTNQVSAFNNPTIIRYAIKQKKKIFTKNLLPASFWVL